MTDAHLTITLPEGHWIEAVSSEHADARFRVLATMPAEETDPPADSGSGILEIATDDGRPVIDSLEAQSAIRRLDVLSTSKGRVLVQFDTSEPLLGAIAASDLPIDPPLAIQDGATKLELSAAHEGLTSLDDQVNAFGLSYQVDRISASSEDKVLTDRQVELIRAALELGYYDTPRGASMTDIADRLEIAKSTCSETLHRAEEKIIKRYAEEQLPEQSVPAVE